MKIRAYLALMVAAILVPVIVFSTLSLDLLLKAERAAALARVRETARAALISIDRELSNSESAVRMLAISNRLEAGDMEAFYRQAQYADRADATWTALLDERGQQLMNTAVPYGTPMPDAIAGARVAQAFAAGVPQVSNLIRGIVTQALLVVVDVPVTTPNGKRYVIAQGYKIAHFKDVLDQLSMPQAWLAGVFDRNGMTIAHRESKTALDGETRPDLRQAILSKKVGVIRNQGEQDRSLYTVLERSAMSGWTVAVGVPEADIDAAARQAVGVAVLGLLAALACATAAAVFFARRLSRSIAAAACAARALGRGEAIGPAAVSGVADVDDVQAAIAEAASVVSHEKQSRLLAEAEREKLFASEHAARTMAEQQNRAKDEFLAMLGHELRNPLAAIMNAVSVMTLKGVPAPSVQRAQEIVARQSKHLSRIVDDLLDVERVRSGKILLARRTVRIDSVVANHVATLRETGRAAQHSISLMTEPAWIDADPTRIEQIVANVLDNAIKYTPAGGSIRVQLSVDVGAAEMLLSVSDTGVGIGPELIPYVFDLFVQGARALDRRQGGLGVGLALVQRLVAMHGGRVVVHSDGPGRGSTVELRLPSLTGASAEEGAPPILSSTRQSVLLIEDNQDGRETMEVMLAAHGYQVRSAADGFEGLQLAAAGVPDIALVDIGLPGMDGYEVARRLRADLRTAEVHLIALTGYGLEADQHRAMGAGFDTHLVKPVELDRLIAALEAGRAVDAPV